MKESAPSYETSGEAPVVSSWAMPEIEQVESTAAGGSSQAEITCPGGGDPQTVNPNRRTRSPEAESSLGNPEAESSLGKTALSHIIVRPEE